jgi:hypothetical protein
MKREMKVRPDRLLALLKEHGFTHGTRTYTVDSFTFVRQSFTDDLFESIVVESQGKHGEAVYASVGVAVTRTVTYKVLGDVHLLEELAENVERGWTIITDENRAKQWESQLARIGASRARQWAQARGPAILKNTEDTRVAVKKYLARLQPATALSELLASIKRRSSPQIVADAERLCDCPGASGVEGTELAHELACYAILCFSEELEGKSFRGIKPFDDSGLMDRIILLADRLLILRENSHDPRAQTIT